MVSKRQAGIRTVSGSSELSGILDMRWSRGMERDWYIEQTLQSRCANVPGAAPWLNWRITQFLPM
jgi:hypothetical protein